MTDRLHWPIHIHFDYHDLPFMNQPLILSLTYLGVACLIVIMAGLMSGLTLGLMSIDKIDLEVLKRTGESLERRLAARIQPVIQDQHFLLVTLLLCNALAMEALPLVLDKLLDPVSAVLISVTVVLLVGELLPQAICSKYGLVVGGMFAWFVRLLKWLTAPISWPIGKLLDLVVGKHEAALYHRPQLKTFVSLHSAGTDGMGGMGGYLSEDELKVIQGALDLEHKTAAEAMTPIERVFMLSTRDVLDESTLRRIMLAGHSRVPVFRDDDRTDIVGLIIVKELVYLNPADRLPVREVRMRSLPQLPGDTPMFDLLDLFKMGRSHIVVLTRPPSTGPSSAPPRHHLRPVDGSPKHVGSPHHADGRLRGDSPPRVGSPRAAPGSNVQFTIHDHHTNMSYELWTDQQQGEPIGIITLEDVIEELMQSEIADETDNVTDNERALLGNAALLVRSLPPALRRNISAKGGAGLVEGAAVAAAGGPLSYIRQQSGREGRTPRRMDSTARDGSQAPEAQPLINSQEA